MIKSNIVSRMTADWDIGFPGEELESDSESSDDDSDVEF